MKFIIVFFTFSYSAAQAITCSNLFQASENSSIQLKGDLEKILLSEHVIDGIDQVRRDYENAVSSLRYSTVVQILSVIRDIENIPLKAQNENVRLILDFGIDHLVSDLAQISPRHMSTKRLIEENIATMVAMVARESSLVDNSSTTSGNVVSLSSNKLKLNSDYATAKKRIYDLIESYRDVDYIPLDIQRERIDELLFVDQRYFNASTAKRQQLIIKIMETIQDPKGDEVATVIERFFSGLEKERLL